MTTAQLVDQVVTVLAKPPGKRDDSDVEAVVSWLRRKAEIFRTTEKKNLVEIVKNCQFQTTMADDVIIQQGEEGDRMFVVIKGSTLVFIDASMTGEEDQTLLVGSPAPSPGGSPDLRQRRRTVDRSMYGRYIMKYGVGKCFGEAALLHDDRQRNATVVSETDCDLLVIDQKLFDHTLRAQQELEYEQICNFVEHHPFFKHMSPKFKRLLHLSLRKESYPYDATIFKQGDPVTALYFIVVGQANIYVEPHTYQKQYPKMWPFEAGVDLYSQEFEWLRESRRNAILRKYEDPSVWPTKSDHLICKRTEGYAAVEKMVQEKTASLCSVYSGEVFGDTELVMKLDSMISTVRCTAVTTAFILDFKNLERLVGRRNPLTMEIIKDKALEKLEMRAESRQGKDVPFLGFLLYKMKEERLPSAKKLPPIKPAKQLPSKDIQIQHLLEKFKTGNAQLIEPCVPGALILKEQMEEKARIRANIRKRESKDINAMLREARRKMNRRQPRSRREIIASLKEMIESELVEVHGSKTASPDEKGTPRKTSLPQLSSKRNSDVSIKQTKSPHLSAEAIPPPRRKSIPSPNPKNVTFANIPEQQDQTPRLSKLSKALASKSSSSSSSSSSDGQTTPRKRKQRKNIVEKPKPISLPAISEARENSSLTASSSEKIAIKHKDSSGIEEQVSREDIRSARSSTSSKREYTRKEVPATSNSPTRLPPLAKPEMKKPESVSPNKWESALKFVNDRINDRFTKTLMSRGGDFDDYETSEMSLQLLENRIKSFFVKHIEPRSVPKLDGKKSDLNLPQLKRFNVDVEDASVSLPKAGGKVWIKKRLCRFANTSIKVKDHEHIHYHMVSELPNFDDVRRRKVIMHHLMAGSLQGSKSNSPVKKQKLPAFLERSASKHENLTI